MTKNELTVANTMNEYLNTIGKNAINEVSVKLNGVEIALVDTADDFGAICGDVFYLPHGRISMTGLDTNPAPHAGLEVKRHGFIEFVLK